MPIKLLFIFTIISSFSNAQASLEGQITFLEQTNTKCRIGLKGTSYVTESDSLGRYSIQNVPAKEYIVNCYCPEMESTSAKITLFSGKENVLNFTVKMRREELEEVSVMGTIKETNRAESPIVTDIYDKKYFEKNPGSSIFDLMDRMNGVRQQVNCNVCGTGDIHINGLEGPYTLIVLDGIPVMGGLSSVYGLSGIPSFLLDKIEVTKGPASSIYGSEAVAGVIHAFTKKANKNPEIQFQNFTTTHGEVNTDLGFNLLLAKKISVFTSANYFLMNQKLDQNKDNFTDIPLQNRISVYQKWKIDRPHNRIFTVSGRIMDENRWGGELNWTPNFRGGDSIYAESIKTKRQELNLAYQLPFKEKFLLLGHFNQHQQDSYYGKTAFKAQQILAYGQMTWEKKFSRHELMAGGNVRQIYYNDNTTITSNANNSQIDQPLVTFLPGIFVQEQFKPIPKLTILASARVDHHPVHGFIFTPRLATMFKFNEKNTLRFHAGNGFRVVNLFSEDHAALTGARQVVIAENLDPERSNSFNIAYSNIKQFKQSWKLESDVNVFYTYFTNRIIADYETDPNKIIYKNLNGFAESKGISVDVKLFYKKTFSFQSGFTFMNVTITENGQKMQQILTEKVSGNWTLSYNFKIPLTIDYTGNLIGPMRLPRLGELDPRPTYSSTYSIQNVQFTYAFSSKFSIFAGVKNFLNWTPAKNLPFLIARTNDPFDKNVVYGADGQILPTAANPNALSFDPSYVYASNQGIRGFVGFRLKFDYMKKRE